LCDRRFEPSPQQPPYLNLAGNRFLQNQLKTTIMKAFVSKLSESGKTMYVGAKINQYAIGYDFGWCSNPSKLEKGDDVPDFNPTGRITMLDKDGNVLKHKDGNEVKQWVF